MKLLTPTVTYLAEPDDIHTERSALVFRLPTMHNPARWYGVM
jgi:hypothetical protein